MAAPILIALLLPVVGYLVPIVAIKYPEILPPSLLNEAKKVSS